MLGIIVVGSHRVGVRAEREEGEEADNHRGRVVSHKADMLREANRVVGRTSRAASLAGIFAATMSTADSLVLSCSAAVTHDLLPKREEKPWVLKLTTAVITVLALGLALSNQSSVFNLVILAWSTLASAFAPLLIVLSARRLISDHAAIFILLIGVAVALLWRELGYHTHVYEGLPAILSATLMGWWLSTPRKAAAFE